MASVGDSIKRILATLEDGEPRAEFGWGIKSKDLRRYLKQFGYQLENNDGNFHQMALKVQEAFMGHFRDEQGPDPESGQMIPWDPYNYPDDPKDHDKAYVERKKREGMGDKLMLRHGLLYSEIMDESNIKIKKGNNPGVEVTTDVGYGIFGHTGFTGPGGKPTDKQTRRPIFDLTEDEEETIIQEMMDEFYRKVEE